MQEWLYQTIQENPFISLIIFTLFLFWLWRKLKVWKLKMITINPFWGQNSRIIQVIDGDTFIINNKARDRVRLIGIDTPESKRSMYKGIEPFGKEAAFYTKKRLRRGKKVILRYDKLRRDKYGRILAYVYLNNGEFFNATLLKKGYAFTMRYPPNVKFAELFKKLERKAKRRRRGIWRIYDAKNKLKSNYKKSQAYRNFKAGTSYAKA